MEARDERPLMRMKGQLAKLDLLILDELGYVPAGKLGKPVAGGPEEAPLDGHGRIGDDR